MCLEWWLQTSNWKPVSLKIVYFFVPSNGKDESWKLSFKESEFTSTRFKFIAFASTHASVGPSNGGPKVDFHLTKISFHFSDVVNKNMFEVMHCFQEAYAFDKAPISICIFFHCSKLVSTHCSSSKLLYGLEIKMCLKTQCSLWQCALRFLCSVCFVYLFSYEW